MTQLLTQKFKDTDWTFAKNIPRPGRHKLHLYPAAMHASCVSTCLDIFNDDGIVLDPFGGSGTVALEAVQRKRFAYSNDLNPLARLITEAKLMDYDDNFLNQIKVVIEDVYKLQTRNNILITQASLIFKKTESDLKAIQQDEYFFERLNRIDINVPRFKNIAYWFLPQVAVALQLIKETLPKHPFFKVTFSEVVRMVSNRRAGEFKLFRRKIDDLVNYNPNVFQIFIKVLKRNWQIISDNKIIGNKCEITCDDAKTLSSIPNNSVSCVITSPPYGDSKTTVAYGEFSRLSLQWLDFQNTNDIDNTLLGGSKAQIQKLSGSVKKTVDLIAQTDAKRAIEVNKFFTDLSEVLYAVDKKCQNGCYHVWVVGNRLVKGIRIPLDMFIKESLQTLNYNCLGIFPRDIPYKAMPRYNSPSNIQGQKLDTMSKESLVILQKK